MNKCIHCENLLEKNQIDFCCQGCETAYQIIKKNGFEDYYSSRIINLNEPKLKPDENLNFNPEEYIIADNENKFFRIDLIIQGLHCGACVWLIENLLKKQPKIIESRVNLTQKTLRIQWRESLEYINDIIKLITSIGYKILPTDQETINDFEKRFDNRIFKALAVAGFGAGNIMLFSFALWFDNQLEISGATKKFLHLLSSIIALPVLIYSGRIFFISAFNSIRLGLPNMDIAISIAIFLASAVSLMQTFRGGEIVYFDSAVMLVFFLLIGRYLDHKARKKAFDIASKFTLLQSGFGRVLVGDSAKILPVKKLQENDILLVASGERIACDGIIIEGFSKIDNSLITGESIPENVSPNSQVFGGAINIESPIKVLINKPSSKGILSQIISLISDIQIKKNIYIRIADNFSKFYTPAVHILALITFVIWYFFMKSNWDDALMNATAVLIITCPCALALAIPIVQTITIGNFLKRGIIIKNGEVLEKINKVECIVLDKTGTLTQGKPNLKKIVEIVDNQTKELNPIEYKNILTIASTIANYSNHPLSKSLSSFNFQALPNNQIKEHRGFGVEGFVSDEFIKIGSAEFCGICDANNKLIEDVMIQNDSNLRCFVKFNERYFVFMFGDSLKEGANEIIDFLNQINKEIILLSGDYESEVKKVANILNIKKYYWQKNPLQKAEILQQLQKQNINFMMIGDGLNDAPSLALSNVSVSFSKAVDITQNIADIVVSSSKLNPIIFLFKYSQKSLRVMKQNLALALIYNIIAVPFAMMGYVVPLLAAIAMSSSSLMVIFNSLKMNYFKNTKK